AEAGYLFLARELVADGRLDPIGWRVDAELEQHLHDVGVRAAVQRTLEGGDAGHERGVNTVQGGRRDSCGKRRRVQLVVRVQHERAVKGPDRERVWAAAGQRIEGGGRVAAA